LASLASIPPLPLAAARASTSPQVENQPLKRIEALLEAALMRGPCAPFSAAATSWHPLCRMVIAEKLRRRCKADDDAGSGTLPALAPVPGAFRGSLRRGGGGHGLEDETSPPWRQWQRWWVTVVTALIGTNPVQDTCKRK
jgi:hypothetical protein